MMWILIPIKILIFFVSKIYFIAWRYFGLIDYRRIVFAHILSYMLFTAIFILYSDIFQPFPRSVIAIDISLSLFFIGFIRISKRLYIESISNGSQKRTLIIGANDRALQIIKSAFSGDISYQPIALISDNRGLIGTYFSELRVYSSGKIESIIKELNIEAVIIAKKLSQKELDILFSRLNSLGVQDIKIAQILQDNKPKLQDISIEDLLARKPQDLDTNSIAEFIFDRVILITGAGGSIGSELSRQVERFGAKKIFYLTMVNLTLLFQEFTRRKLKKDCIQEVGYSRLMARGG